MPLIIQAQSKGTFRGVVVDSLSNEKLNFANVYIDEIGRGTTTDANGIFHITSIPSGKFYNVTVSYVGYATKHLKVYIGNNQITEEKIELTTMSFMMETIEKLGSFVKAPNDARLSFSNISVKGLQTLPKGVEADLFRSLQFLPGVQSTGDVSARYNVRGGSSNQNLVLLNGATLYSPFHALGLFSVVDPEIINSVEFYKGGFPTEYSGRLSSVMSIVTKEGNSNRFSGKASASYLSGKTMLEGPFPNGSFFISGRKSFSSEIVKKFLNNQNAPLDFYDFAFSATYSNPKIVSGRRFTVHGFFSGDNLNNNNPAKEDYKWSNEILGLKLTQLIENTPFLYQINLTSSKFRGEIIPNYSSARYLNNRIDDVTLSSHLAYILPSKNEFMAGTEFKEIETFLELENNRGIVNTIRSYGANISFFAKYKFQEIKNFGFEAGLRFNVTRIAAGTSGDNFLEPRISSIYRITENLSVKGGWGRYFQEFTTISDENSLITIFEPWIVSPSYLKPASSDHFIFGFEYNPFPVLSMEIESYYKVLADVPTLNEEKYYFDDPDLLPGEGENYGIEFSFNYYIDIFKVSGGYTWSRAFKTVNGFTYAPRYDVRNAATMIVQADLGKEFIASASFTYHSGMPYTQIAGYYDRAYFSDLANRFLNYSPYLLLGSKNTGRLPDYHRMDLSISKSVEIYSAKVNIDVSILNVYDRENIFYFDRGTGERVNMLPFLPTATIKVEI